MDFPPLFFPASTDMVDAILTAYVAATDDLPFVWGARDCTVWGADWCMLRFGFDPAATVRGRYKTKTQADALIGGDLPSLCRALYGRTSRLRTY